MNHFDYYHYHHYSCYPSLVIYHLTIMIIKNTITKKDSYININNHYH